MNLIYAAILFIVALLTIFAGITRIGAWQIERRFPADGTFATVNDTRMHFHRIAKTDSKSSMPPVLFLHGASGNLYDQMSVFRDRFDGKADLIFLDRPGHGWSQRGPAENAYPDGQARTIAALLDHLKIDKAIIVGHSFGGAVAASFTLNHPERTAGTVFLSPVSHKWPGGISWYYTLTATPVIGWLFSETLALPAGLSRLNSGTACVFAPNRATENFTEQTRVAHILRPERFRNNAIDVANLYDYVARVQDNYKTIKTPAIIITGDKDTIVLPWIHSTGLAKDIENAELLWIKNLGHKSDHVATDLAVAAIANLAGASNDLQAMAQATQARLASDTFGPVERCLDPEDKEIRKALAAQQG